jgi:hypothetical protein
VKTLKALFWGMLFVIGLLGLILPIAYWWQSREVPRLEAENDLQKLMKSMVEGERMSLKLGLVVQDKSGITYEPPEMAKIPRDFVAFFIMQIGCPSYFSTPQEQGVPWQRRMFEGEMFDIGFPGDGRCERFLALSIAEMISVGPGFPRTIAASKIHGFLQKDQLVAYYLSGTIFDRGVVGVEAATQALFGRSSDQLNLAELAEFSLALPINGWYDDVASCKNPTFIKRERDGQLLLLAKAQLISRERADTARDLPLGCMKRP